MPYLGAFAVIRIRIINSTAGGSSSPCIIVLFCLFTLVTVIFFIRLRVAIENRRVYT